MEGSLLTAWIVDALKETHHSKINPQCSYGVLVRTPSGTKFRPAPIRLKYTPSKSFHLMYICLHGLTELQNDHLFISHFHEPKDGYAYLEDGNDWYSDGQLSSSSVIHKPANQTLKQHAKIPPPVGFLLYFCIYCYLTKFDRCWINSDKQAMPSPSAQM